MLRVTRFLVLIVLYLTLSVLAFSQATPASVPEPEVIYGATSVEWPASVPDAPVLLTVSGPAGLYLRQENPAGTWGRFSLVDDQGQMRPDGIYKWELVSQAGWEVEQANQVESGWFQIQNGKVVAEGIGEKLPMVVEEQAPASSLYVDNQGRVGLGTSVPASQLHLKGSNPAVTLEDTTTGGGAFTLHSLEKGDGSLGLFDQAGQARWLVDSEGRIGINTKKPTSTLTVDGYIEATKGFLLNGRPLRGFGAFGSQPLYTESDSNNFFGTGAGPSTTTGSYNSFFGGYAGYANTTGDENSFFGYRAGNSNTSGLSNSFFGYRAGDRNTTGGNNSFFGVDAGLFNTTGSSNSFFGEWAGRANTEGYLNSFFGSYSGLLNTGYLNSFFGSYAGRSSTTGSYNSFFGGYAGYDNSTGEYNSFFGFSVGDHNTTGNYNSFFGGSAGRLNTSGGYNSFFGHSAGYDNTTGNNNSFFGSFAGYYNSMGNGNSFFGFWAGSSNTTEHNNSFIGHYSNGAVGITNATALGYRALVSQSNSVVLGSIAGVAGATSYVNVGIGTTTPARQLHLAGPNAVFRMDRTTDTAAFILVRTDPTGVTPWKTYVVGTNASDVNRGEFIINDIGSAVGGGGNRRMTISNEGDVTFTGNVYAATFTPTSSLAFKTNIRTFENALETVNRLRGVRFDWKESGKPAVGLIAEEVEEVVPEVVTLENGKARGVNYANLVAVLVEAVKEQQKTINEQQAELDSLKGLRAEVEKLKGLLKEK